MDPFWQNNFTCLGDKQSFMFNNEVLSDINFRVLDIDGNDIIIPAHKYVLATSSQVFYVLIYGEIGESDKSPIFIPDIPAKSFLKFLKYIYTYDIKFDNDVEDILAILYAAKKYIIPKLCEICCDYIKMTLTPDNVCTYLMKSKLFGEGSLIEECWNLIKYQTESVILSDSFLTMDYQTLCEFLTHSELNIFNERIVYDGIVKWAHFHCHHDNVIKEIDTKNQLSLNKSIAKEDNEFQDDNYSMGGNNFFHLLSTDCQPLLSIPHIPSKCVCCTHCQECGRINKVVTNTPLKFNSLITIHRPSPSQIRSKLRDALFYVRFANMSLEDFSDGPALDEILIPREVIDVYLYHHGTSRERIKKRRLQNFSNGPLPFHHITETFKKYDIDTTGSWISPNLVETKVTGSGGRGGRSRPHSICCLSTPTNIASPHELIPAIISPLFPTLTTARVRPPLGICSRFSHCSSRSHWRYDGRAMDSIQFTVDRRILLAGMGLYGSSRALETPFGVRAKLVVHPSVSHSELNDMSDSGNRILLEEGIQFLSNGLSDPYQVMFKAGPVPLKADTPYLLSLVITGGDENNYYGQGGSSCVVVNCCKSAIPSSSIDHKMATNGGGDAKGRIRGHQAPDNVRFTFEISTEGNNGTSVQGGQIPQLLFYSY